CLTSASIALRACLCATPSISSGTGTARAAARSRPATDEGATAPFFLRPAPGRLPPRLDFGAGSAISSDTFDFPKSKLEIKAFQPQKKFSRVRTHAVGGPYPGEEFNPPPRSALRARRRSCGYARNRSDP